LHYLVNVALLVSGYRISFFIRPGQAALLGAGTGVCMAVMFWLWMSIHGMTLAQTAGVAAADIAVLVPSFALCARRESLPLTLLNLAVGSAAALILPIYVIGWIGK